MSFLRSVAILRLHRGFSIAERKARRETDEMFETLFPPLRGGHESDKKTDLLRITNYSDNFFCSAGVPTGVFRR